VESNFQTLLLGITIAVTSLSFVNCGSSGRLSVQQEIQRAVNSNAEELDLSNRALTRLPPDIVRLPQLKVLRLNGNELTELPPEIGQLTQLTELYLSDNQLQALPPEVGQLARLRKLDVGNNQVSSLPTQIGHLSSLEQLLLNYSACHRISGSYLL
jgi:Leucine-rich repeat (LRR) protein